MAIHTRRQGFTLVELITTMAVLALALALGVPALRDSVARGNIAAEVNRLVASINFARSQAVAKRQVVTLIRTSPTAGDWSDGWDVFTDTGGEGNQPFDGVTGDILLKSFSSNSSQFTINSNAPAAQAISFDLKGRIIANGAAVQFAICDADPDSTNPGRLIDVSLVGRSSVSTIDVPSPALCSP